MGATFNVYYSPQFDRITNRMIWPETIQETYKPFRDSSGEGGYIFKSGSDEDARFLQDAKRSGLNPITASYFKSSPKNILEHPYYFLMVKGGTGTQYDGFIQEGLGDRTNACPGNGNFICPTGARQQRKIIFDPKKIFKLDIMQVSYPNFYVISRKLKDLIDTAELTGYRTIPCLEKGQDYDEADLNLEHRNETIERNASYFQLIVTERSNSPMHFRVGFPVHFCSKCGAVYRHVGVLSSYFPAAGLRPTDFQTSDQFQIPTGKVFSYSMPFTVVSSRFIKLVGDHKLKGLFKFKSIPFDIPHWSVDAR